MNDDHLPDVPLSVIQEAIRRRLAEQPQTVHLRYCRANTEQHRGCVICKAASRPSGPSAAVLEAYVGEGAYAFGVCRICAVATLAKTHAALMDAFDQMRADCIPNSPEWDLLLNIQSALAAKKLSSIAVGVKRKAQ